MALERTKRRISAKKVPPVALMVALTLDSYCIFNAFRGKKRTLNLICPEKYQKKVQEKKTSDLFFAILFLKFFFVFYIQLNKARKILSNDSNLNFLWCTFSPATKDLGRNGTQDPFFLPLSLFTKPKLLQTFSIVLYIYLRYIMIINVQHKKSGRSVTRTFP